MQTDTFDTYHLKIRREMKVFKVFAYVNFIIRYKAGINLISNL